ncbi:MAG TPA: hypothetical protein VLA31_06920, partial [Burkholderiaceae bacterium]|nr:hypothetical protein [Burkholderiaceae bacterium]
MDPSQVLTSKHSLERRLQMRCDGDWRTLRVVTAREEINSRPSKACVMLVLRDRHAAQRIAV